MVGCGGRGRGRARTSRSWSMRALIFLASSYSSAMTARCLSTASSCSSATTPPSITASRSGSDGGGATARDESGSARDASMEPTCVRTDARQSGGSEATRRRAGAHGAGARPDDADGEHAELVVPAAERAARVIGCTPSAARGSGAQVVLVDVAFVEEEAEIVALGGLWHVHRLQLTRLELAPLVGVEREVAEANKRGARNAASRSGHAGRHRADEELNLAGDFELVRKQLNLLHRDPAVELQHQLLRVLAPLRRLPAPRVRVEALQLARRVRAVLARARGHLVAEQHGLDGRTRSKRSGAFCSGALRLGFS